MMLKILEVIVMNEFGFTFGFIFVILSYFWISSIIWFQDKAFYFLGNKFFSKKGMLQFLKLLILLIPFSIFSKIFSEIFVIVF